MSYDSLAVPLGLILVALGAAVVTGAARSKVATSSQRSRTFLVGLIVFIGGLTLDLGGAAGGIDLARGIGIPTALVIGVAIGFWHGHMSGAHR